MTAPVVLFMLKSDDKSYWVISHEREKQEGVRVYLIIISEDFCAEVHNIIDLS